MNIFCTVGSRLPFDRLTKAVYKFAESHSSVATYFQIGEGAGFVPAGAQYQELLDEEQFVHQVDQCDLIVAHAGMGTIITALTRSRPVLVMPRRECFHETRNDHQVFTATKLEKMGLVHVAMNESVLTQELENAATYKPAPQMGLSASERLITTVQSFIDRDNATR